MRERKVRFGVSVPEKLTKNLNKLASVLGIDRSRIVSNALQEYIQMHRHYIVEHECRGVLIVIDASKHIDLLGILNSYHDVVRFYNHANLGGTCVDIILVAGQSTEITRLHRELAKKLGCTIQYVPVACNALDNKS